MADDLESPMVFVPAGGPEPEEWKARHPGWVKFPATMVPRGGTAAAGEATKNQPVFLHDRILPGRADTVSDDTGSPASRSSSAEDALPVPGMGARGQDPIGVYTRVSAAADPTRPGNAAAGNAARKLAEMKRGDANERAFLRLLRWEENGGAPDEIAYRARFGGKEFMTDAEMQDYVPKAEPFSRKKTETKGQDVRPRTSTAGGAYQILGISWREAREALDLNDFLPASQDRIAIWLIERRRALDDVRVGRIDEAFKSLSGIIVWPDRAFGASFERMPSVGMREHWH